MMKSIAVGAAALALLVFAGPSSAQIGPPEPPLEGPGCPRVGTTSPRTSERTTMTINNPNRRNYTVYWIDFGGSPVPYAEMQGRTRYTVNTFVGHVWVLVGANGRCLTVFRAQPGNPEFTF